MPPTGAPAAQTRAHACLLADASAHALAGGLNYSKWDNIVDSDDEADGPRPSTLPRMDDAQEARSAANAKRSGGFVRWLRDKSTGGPGDPNIKQNSYSAVTLDANGDGHLDFLVVNGGTYFVRQPNTLHLGDGKGGWLIDTSSGGPGDPSHQRDSRCSCR